MKQTMLVHNFVSSPGSLKYFNTRTHGLDYPFSVLHNSIHIQILDFHSNFSLHHYVKQLNKLKEQLVMVGPKRKQTRIAS